MVRAAYGTCVQRLLDLPVSEVCTWTDRRAQRLRAVRNSSHSGRSTEAPTWARERAIVTANRPRASVGAAAAVVVVAAAAALPSRPHANVSIDSKTTERQTDRRPRSLRAPTRRLSSRAPVVGRRRLTDVERAGFSRPPAV